MNARIRMISGEVIVVNNFGPRHPDDLSPGERELFKAACPVFAKVDGGAMIVTELTTGRPFVILNAHVASVSTVE